MKPPTLGAGAGDGVDATATASAPATNPREATPGDAGRTGTPARTRQTQSLVWLFRRVGPVLAVLAALVALKWPAMFDLDAYLAAARAVAAGQSPYAATQALGVDQWGTLKVYVSPPFVAQVLAPFSSLPIGVVFAGWTAAGLLAVIATLRVVDRDALAARAPFLVFSLVYVWGSLVLGQVNLFTLAGLLLAFGSRSDRTAGLGLALAIVTRALPGAFVIVFVLERRWRAIAWTAGAVLAVILVNPGLWVEFLAVARQASGLPTLTAAVVQTRSPRTRRCGSRRPSPSESRCWSPRWWIASASSAQGWSSAWRWCSCRPTRGTTGWRSCWPRSSCSRMAPPGAGGSCSRSWACRSSRSDGRRPSSR